MRLIFLGTGGSWPTKNRNVSAIALKMNSEIILFDCGEGTQRQFMKSTVSFMQVKKICISHLHGDHFLGLSGLLHTMAFNDRKDMLEIFVPPGCLIPIKTYLKIGYFKPEFEIKIHEVCEDTKMEFEKYVMKFCTTEHCGIPSVAYCVEEKERAGKFDLEKAKKLCIPEGPLYRRLQKGERINFKGKIITPSMVLGPKRKGRKVVYTGDTLPSEKIIKFAKNCDVLIHDGTLDSSLEDKAVEYGHSTAKQAAEIALKAGAKTLFLAHISPRYEDATLLEKEAREIFKNTYVGEDFLEYTIKYPD